LLLIDWHNLHLRHFRLLASLQKTNQPASLLRIMGKHTLQHRNPNVAIGHKSWKGLASLPISRLSYPTVRYDGWIGGSLKC